MDTSLSINPAITDELVQTIETILRKWEPKFFNKSNEERDFIRLGMLELILFFDRLMYQRTEASGLHLVDLTHEKTHTRFMNMSDRFEPYFLFVLKVLYDGDDMNSPKSLKMIKRGGGYTHLILYSIAMVYLAVSFNAIINKMSGIDIFEHTVRTYVTDPIDRTINARRVFAGEFHREVLVFTEKITTELLDQNVDLSDRMRSKLSTVSLGLYKKHINWRDIINAYITVTKKYNELVRVGATTHYSSTNLQMMDMTLDEKTQMFEKIIKSVVDDFPTLPSKFKEHFFLREDGSCVNIINDGSIDSHIPICFTSAFPPSFEILFLEEPVHPPSRVLSMVNNIYNYFSTSQQCDMIPTHVTIQGEDIHVINSLSEKLRGMIKLRTLNTNNIPAIFKHMNQLICKAINPDVLVKDRDIAFEELRSIWQDFTHKVYRYIHPDKHSNQSKQITQQYTILFQDVKNILDELKKRTPLLHSIREGKTGGKTRKHKCNGKCKCNSKGKSKNKKSRHLRNKMSRRKNITRNQKK